MNLDSEVAEILVSLKIDLAALQCEESDLFVFYILITILLFITFIMALQAIYKVCMATVAESAINM